LQADNPPAIDGWTGIHSLKNPTADQLADPPGVCQMHSQLASQLRQAALRSTRTPNRTLLRHRNVPAGLSKENLTVMSVRVYRLKKSASGRVWQQCCAGRGQAGCRSATWKRWNMSCMQVNIFFFIGHLLAIISMLTGHFFEITLWRTAEGPITVTEMARMGGVAGARAEVREWSVR